MEWLLSSDKADKKLSRVSKLLLSLATITFSWGIAIGWNERQQIWPCLSKEPEVKYLSGEPTIKIDIEGAVKNPGVYQLSTNSVLLDALKTAGGLSKEADRQAIVESFNLAKPLSAGEKLIIPSTSDSRYQAQLDAWCEQRQASSTQKATSTQNQSQVGDNSISINQASQTELEKLPNIGEKRATDIIQNRPYTTLDQLVTKKVVTENIFRDLKNLIEL